jgi:hypothetical protein
MIHRLVSPARCPDSPFNAVIAPLSSSALQRDVPLEKLNDLPSDAQCVAAVSIFNSIPRKVS